MTGFSSKVGNFILIGFMALTYNIHASPEDRKPSSKETLKINQGYLDLLPFSNQEDFDNASKGLLSPSAELQIFNDKQMPVWSLDNFMRFEKTNQASPETVNPSLWRMSLLNMNHGLFKVTERVYQIRGYDLAVMSIIDAGLGYVIVDPLTSTETAKAGLEKVKSVVGDKPVIAVIHTHSHADHFGGVRGVVNEKELKTGLVKIIAPAGFIEHAISENIMAGTAMSRRAGYMYGLLLPQDAQGSVDAGLGKGLSSGTMTLIDPTHTINKTGEEIKLGNLTFIFQLTPNTEAPSEMNFFIKELSALCMAENITHTMHNLYSLRGAQVRDSVSWVKHINESIKLFGNHTDVVFSSHHWPTWGKENIITLLENQRDAYKYIHDQTLNLANQGYTMTEIAEVVTLPPSLQKVWADREYYGTVNHNVKAVYQRYLGWFDANPSHLHELPPVETSKKTVEYMGGSDAILKKAKKDFDAGEYRWAAQVLNHVVFAEPENKSARYLLADTLEQLGYQSESAPWRNFYLTGAQELRQGVKVMPAASTVSPDIIAAMSLDMIFDYLGVRLNGPRAHDVSLNMNWNFPDIHQQYRVTVKNGVLNYFPEESDPKAQISITLDRQKINDFILGRQTYQQAIADGSMKIEGDKAQLDVFFALLDSFNPWFNIVTP